MTRYTDSGGRELAELDPRRLVDLQKLNHINTMLCHSWTLRGVANWWMRERTQLDGKSPQALLIEQGPVALDRLIELAEGGLESGGE
jgi:hypothetical protein